MQATFVLMFALSLALALKSYRKADAGVHKNQALVLVNYGKATGNEVFQLAEKIQKTVLEKFRIPLEIEVNVIA